jgi:hypothetical protein
MKQRKITSNNVEVWSLVSLAKERIKEDKIRVKYFDVREQRQQD